MELKNLFEKAVQDVQKLKSKPDNSTLLELYSLFKQANEGDVSGSRPGFLDLKGRAKFDAWTQKKGMPSPEAMQKYVDLVQKLSK